MERTEEAGSSSMEKEEEVDISEEGVFSGCEGEEGYVSSIQVKHNNPPHNTLLGPPRALGCKASLLWECPPRPMALSLRITLNFLNTQDDNFDQEEARNDIVKTSEGAIPSANQQDPTTDLNDANTSENNEDKTKAGSGLSIKEITLTSPGNKTTIGTKDMIVTIVEELAAANLFIELADVHSHDSRLSHAGPFSFSLHKVAADYLINMGEMEAFTGQKERIVFKVISNNETAQTQPLDSKHAGPRPQAIVIFCQMPLGFLGHKVQSSNKFDLPKEKIKEATRKLLNSGDFTLDFIQSKMDIRCWRNSIGVFIKPGESI